MTNLCGHKRDVLIWALTDPDPLNNAEREKRVIVPIGGPIDITQYAVTPKQRAAACVLDPAKLAEMLAEEGRRLGLGFWHGPNEPREPLGGGRNRPRAKLAGFQFVPTKDSKPGKTYCPEGSIFGAWRTTGANRSSWAGIAASIGFAAGDGLVGGAS